MAPHIFPRQENFVTTNDTAGGLIAGFVGLVVLLCLLCLLRFHRSRANKIRISGKTATSFRVGGGVRPTMTETNPLSTSIPHFSRRGLTASIVMPEKCIVRVSSHGLSDKAVISSKLEPSPISSTPSRLRPLSNVSSRSPRPRVMSILNPASPRHSRSSSGFNVYAQYSFAPGLGSRPFSVVSTSSTQARPVRQLFPNPVMPDELSLVRYGEYLSVLRSFDDGWCLVARDTSRSSRASRLSAWVKTNADDVDIGLVPAWVFIRPLKGVTTTRPFRSASINALNFGQNPAPADARDAIISWSNFA